ncbi:group-specific protein [Peribacillus kribbensis]|uniref:group-specific protein n=1 Tax=Peribacillus kribbensis TaxID=356658 RepID=UPI00068487DF|nr:group-specific protein [Peribacillus kribbensis]
MVYNRVKTEKEEKKKPFIEVEVSEQEIREMFLDELKRHVKRIEAELTFWDTKELIRQTSLSWNTINEYFFYDPRFPKYRLGRKWMFPAKKTREFLLMWLEEQK